MVDEQKIACYQSNIALVPRKHTDILKGILETNQRTTSVSSRERFCFTQEAKPSPARGFWLGNSPPGKSSPRAYDVTHRLCFKNAALLINLASGPANGRQLEPGTSL